MRILITLGTLLCLTACESVTAPAAPKHPPRDRHAEPTPIAHHLGR